MQPKLPLVADRILYECANPDCFYCGSLLDRTDVKWVHFWNSESEDLDFRAVCPACNDPMMIWDDDDDTMDAPTCVVSVSL